MKSELPEQHRIEKGRLASSKYDGANGAFYIPNPIRGAGSYFLCIISNGMGWDHVSVTLWQIKHQDRSMKSVAITPTWREMCFVKDTFFDKEEPAMQIHPPESMYVNNHPHCLHLWRPQDHTIPFPHPLMVGIMGYELGEKGKSAVRAATPKRDEQQVENT